MRNHGSNVPNEFSWYGKDGEAVYTTLVGAVKLRYSLLTIYLFYCMEYKR